MRYSQTSALTSASFDESTVIGLVSSIVGCASASNDNKIADRQITANTRTKQHKLDIIDVAATYVYSTDRVTLLALLFSRQIQRQCYA